MAHTEEKLESREIFAGHVVNLTVDTVRLEDGSTAAREVVHHHGGACVLALTEHNEVYLVRQYRYALGEELWELPAGKLEKGEDPFEAAKRELAEECGVTADAYTSLGIVYPTVGYDSEKIYLWAARGLHPVPQNLDEGEFLDVHKMPVEQAVALVMEDAIRDSKTAIGLLKCAAMMEKGEL